ncbi:MAG: DUF4925 domain-containing protein [Tannerellaceae bacterium]|jgi:hypothetical protein|nr:DUF4925 domain-containing protein [Tannerellaceae bacterium]
MKKNCLFFLFVMVCTSVLLFSCGKDDPDPEPEPTPVNPTPEPPEPEPVPTWKDAAGTFKSDDGTLKLTLSDKDVAGAATKTATLAVGTGESAKITLTNIVPDDATVEIDNVTVTKDGDNKCTFSGEATVDGTVISVAGALTGITESSKALSLNVTRKITSPLAGDWGLSFNAAGADVAINVKTGDAATDGILNTAVGPMLGGLLAQKVEDVTLTLGEDGKFDVTWQETGKDEPSGMPDAIKAMVSIYYFVSDGKVYVALDKSLLALLSVVMPEIPWGIDLNELIAMIAEDKGDFIALPLQAAQDENKATFSVGKGLVSVLLPILTPLLEGSLPAEVPEFVGQLIQNLPIIAANAETFDVGLGFKKIVLTTY